MGTRLPSLTPANLPPSTPSAEHALRARLAGLKRRIRLAEKRHAALTAQHADLVATYDELLAQWREMRRTREES